MREYAHKSEVTARTLDPTPKTLRQAPLSDILQTYKYGNSVTTGNKGWLPFQTTGQAPANVQQYGKSNQIYTIERKEKADGKDWAVLDQINKTTVQKASQSNTIQKASITRLRIGIMGEKADFPYQVDDLPDNTCVWILTNKKVDAETLFKEKKKVKKKEKEEVKLNKPCEIYKIIDKNKDNITKDAVTEEKDNKKLFKSGVFQVPNKKTNIDYSFLRYAALKSYGTWQPGNPGWPSITDNKTLIETIDSDIGGIQGKNEGGLTGEILEKEGEEFTKVKPGWLAEAGVYTWDWEKIKDNEKIISIIKEPDKRKEKLEEFSTQYAKAEIEAREKAAQKDIFSIYFPEPATRLSSDAIKLLNGSGFENHKVHLNQQIGHARESIGLIAGLVFLADKADNHENVFKMQSKNKLKFDKNYQVKTDLGSRKDKYITLFKVWYNNSEEGKAPDINQLDKAKTFDQSYLNDKTAINTNKAHKNTYNAMSNDYLKNTPEKNPGKHFFNPKS